MHEPSLLASDAVLVSEGSNLKKLLGEIREQHGDAAQVISQERDRHGGVLGFFAHEVHRVTYRVERSDMMEQEPAAETPTADSVALLDLLGSADLVEQAMNQPAPTQALPDQRATEPETDADFARVLQALTARQEPDVTELAAEAPVRTEGGAPVTQLRGLATRNRLEMLMQLRDIGVPVLLGPRGEHHNVYQALTDVIDELPPPPLPPRHAGEVLALVGELTPTLRAAVTVATTLRLAPSTIRVAGQPSYLQGGYATIGGPGEAAQVGAELHASSSAAIVVIATDAGEPDLHDPWPREMLRALRPTAVWAVVDASRKTEDARAQLDRLGTVDALAVHSAQLSTSPATVWDLDLPIALLDGRVADTCAWAGLLLGLLRDSARQRATA